MRAFIQLISICSLALLSGCSNPSKRPEPAALFTTHISDNGSKFFVYRLQRPSREQRDSRGEGMRDGRGSGGPAAGVRSKKKSRSFDLEKGLLSVLETNQYCRDGYMVLERLDYLIRGECHETATLKDRERFLHVETIKGKVGQ